MGSAPSHFTSQATRDARRLRLAALPSFVLWYFDVRPSGSIQEGVIFTFYKPDGSQPSRFRISNLVIQQHMRSGWRLIWALDGARSLNTIAYGASYPGLKQSRPAPKLVQGQLYRVAARSDGQFGGADFLIDHSGDVVIRPSTIWRRS
jgi:hypothetical protein